MLRATPFISLKRAQQKEYLDSAGVFKNAIVSIMATLAKQERVKISERTRAGLARARAQGKQLGRPKNMFDRQKAIEMRRTGSVTRRDREGSRRHSISSLPGHPRMWPRQGLTAPSSTASVTG